MPEELALLGLELVLGEDPAGPEVGEPLELGGRRVAARDGADGRAGSIIRCWFSSPWW